MITENDLKLEKNDAILDDGLEINDAEILEVFKIDNDIPKEIAEEEDILLEDGNIMENEENDENDDSLPMITGSDFYAREIHNISILTPEEELRLAILSKNGTEEEKRYAKNELITHNLRYVIKIASRYKNCGISFEDLIQEGNIGLMKAVDRYDPYSGYRLTTYATWWIRQTITRHIANQAKAIRLPVHIIDDIQKLKKAERKFEQEGNPRNEMEWLEKETGFTTGKILELRRLRKDIRSLDTPISSDGSGDGDSVLGDFIADKETTTPEDIAMQNDLRERLNIVMQILSDKERLVLKLRFGLDGNGPMTLEEVGKILHVTRERIRQIEAKALRKMKNPKYGKYLSDYRSP